MTAKAYEAQVELLVRVLPEVARTPRFALKGGTAINLFHSDLPRLSVDIDLTFLEIADRDASLARITEGLTEIQTNIARIDPELRVRRIAGGGDDDTRLQVSADGAQIKIETSPVSRGALHEPVLMSVRDVVAERYGFAEILVVSEMDLFAGKIVAAMDRQHPRDLFDMREYMARGSISDILFDTFLIYACFSKRPLHEILSPNKPDIAPAFDREFAGMSSIEVTLDDLETTRIMLFAEVKARLTSERLAVLKGFLSGEPDFAPIGLERAAELPAIKWKLLNLKKLQKNNPAKHGDQIRLLHEILDTSEPATPMV